jgi:hypothetical protein
VNESGFRNLYWGFLFIMVDFRIQGVDILPDIIGFILFAMGFGVLAANSIHFSKAASYNLPMIFLSVFAIYERPAQGGGVQLGLFGPFGILIGLASIILSLFVVYHLFMGIKDMAVQRQQMDLQAEAEERWSQYLFLQIALVLAFILIFVPVIGILYIIALLIASIVLVVKIMSFIKMCEDRLSQA